MPKELDRDQFTGGYVGTADSIAQQKLQALEAAKNKKLNNLSAEKLQYDFGYNLGEQVYTRDDGSKYQFAFNEDGTYAHDSAGNWIEQDITPGTATRNLYIDNTVDGNYKLGLARNDLNQEALDKGLTPAAARYLDKRGFNPYSTEYKPKEGEIDPATGLPAQGYDGTPGPRGVTPEDGFLMDVELPYNLATQMEYDIHTNAGQVANRAQAGMTKEEAKAAFGAGRTEYTTPAAPMWNADAKVDKKDVDVGTILPKDPYYIKEDAVTPEIVAAQIEAGRSVSDKVLEELGQVASAVPASIAKGAIELADVAQELGTLPMQTIYSAVTGKSQDIDLIPNEFKEKLIKSSNEFFGYNEALDEKTVNEIKKSWDNIGLDIMDPSTYKVLTNTENLAKIGDMGVAALLNPSLTTYMVGEIVGAGGVAGGAIKVAGKVGAKVLPKLTDKAGELLKLNKTKADEAIAGIKKSDMSKADKSAALAKVKQDYTLGKKVADFMKGTTFTNTDMAIRVNNDLEEFKENNNGESADAFKTLQIIGLNRIASNAEIGALKIEAGLTKKVVANTVKTKIKEALKDLTKGFGIEAVQETFDGIVENINQKLYSSDYDGKTVGDILSDASSEILTGTVLGGAGGAQVSAAVSASGVGSMVKKGAESLQRKKESVDTFAEDAPETETPAPLSPEEKEEIAAFTAGLETGEIDITANPSEVMENIYKYEEMLSRSNKKETKELIQRQFDATKKSIDAVLAKADTDEEVTFGSTKGAEAFVSYVIENNLDDKKQLSVDIETKLKKIANKAGLDEKTYKRIKDSYTVQLEAEEGSRGYTTYEREIRSLLNDKNADPAILRKKVKAAQDYLVSQEKYVTELEAGIKEASKLADAANKEGGRLLKKQVKIEIPQKKSVSKWTINITKNAKGLYEVNKASMDLLEAKKGNVAGIREALEGTSAALKNVGVENAIDTFTVPVADSDITEVKRKADRSYYGNNNVTKAIVGQEPNKKWATYNKLNERFINSSEYTSEDTVVIDPGKLREYKKDGKTEFALDKTVEAELRKAALAGATIILDRGLAAAKGRDNKQQRAVKRYLTRYIGKDNLYANPKNSNTGKRNLHIFKPKTVVAEIDEKATKEFTESKARKKAVQAAKDSLDIKIAEALLEESKKVNISKEEFDTLSDEYKGNKENILKDARTRVLKKVKKALDIIANNTSFAKIDENTNVFTAEVLKVLDNDPNMVALVSKNLEVIQSRRTEIKGKLKDYKEAKDKAAKGDTSALEEFILLNDTNEVKLAVNDSYSKGKPDLYLYEDTKGVIRKTPDKTKVPKDVPWQSLVPLDISKMINLDKIGTTSLTIATIEELGNSDLTEMTNGFKEALADIIDTKVKSEIDENYDLLNSPGRGLLLNNDKHINETVAAAMAVSIGEIIQNNGYMMSDKYKSAEDLANMLGLDNAFGIGKEVRELVGDKGMLHTTAVDAIGRSIAANLGIKPNSDGEYDAQVYEALVADLANMALLAGAKAKMFTFDKVNAREYAKTVMGITDTSSIAKDATIAFVRTNSTEEGYVAPLSNMLDRYKSLIEEFPLEQTMRKEPSLRRFSKNELEQAATAVRKDVTDTKVPKQAQEAIKNLMGIEWVADVDAIKTTFEIFDKYGKGKLGYIAPESKEYAALRADAREVQEAKNRDIEKSIEELAKVAEGQEGKVSLWYKWFYTKNQRYMMDSNTVNPQTGKQLERFVIYPKSFVKNTLQVVHNGKSYVFTKKINGKVQDVTLEIKASIAQGLGFGIDKKHSAQAVELADQVLAMDSVQLAEFKDKLFTEKEVKIGMLHAEVEHFAHAVQVVMLLDAIVKDNKTSIQTPLSAEFDAVTSGFGIKNMQFPLDVGNDKYSRKHLPAVGIYIKKGYWDREEEIVTPEVFGNGIDGTKPKEINDSYEGLGLGMPDKADFITNVGKYFGNPKRGEFGAVAYVKANMTPAKWGNIVEVIPSKVGNQITKDLRNIFKYPFMTFNYASALKSVRNLLSNTLADSILDSLYKAKEKDADFNRWENFANVLVGAMGRSERGVDAVTYLQKELNENKADQIIIDGKVNLFDYVSATINLSVGQEAEAIFNNEFKDYIYLQKVITNSFSAVAEVFIKEYEAKLIDMRKKGPITKAQLKVVLQELKDKFPSIAGPLSEEAFGKDFDGIPIIDTKRSTAGDKAYFGRPNPQTTINREEAKKLGLDQDSMIAHYRIKKFAAAISAGAVIPIHAIDGAIMAKLINWGKSKGIDIVAIHDAIIVAPEHTLEVTKKYNELMYTVNKDYDMLGALKNLSDNVLNKVDLSDKAYSVEYKGAMREGKGKTFKASVVTTLRTFIEESIDNLDEAYKENTEAREKLFREISEFGADFNHMASLPGGGYSIKAKAKSNEALVIIAENNDATVEDVEEIERKLRECMK